MTYEEAMDNLKDHTERFEDYIAEMGELQSEMAELAEVERLTAERDTMAAHVGDLRGALEDAMKPLKSTVHCSTRQMVRERISLAIDTISDALATTPEASLAERDRRVKAEALEEICKDVAHGGLCRRVAVDYLEWIDREPLASQLHQRPMIRMSIIDAAEITKRAEANRLQAANGAEEQDASE